ncbi:MAG: hypothetical protein AAF483_15460, partial [Planctomycetota bacterium]
FRCSLSNCSGSNISTPLRLPSNDREGKGITDTPGGLKLQDEGHDVRYRNIWIKEMEFEQSDTDF